MLVFAGVVAAELAPPEISMLISVAALVAAVVTARTLVWRCRPGIALVFPVLAVAGTLPLWGQPDLFTMRDYVRDLMILGATAAFMILGQVLGSTERLLVAGLRTLYAGGLCLAVVHLIRVGAGGFAFGTAEELRDAAGRGAVLEVLALASAYLLARLGYRVVARVPHWLVVGANAVIVLSIITSLSRGLVLDSAIFVLVAATERMLFRTRSHRGGGVRSGLGVGLTVALLITIAVAVPLRTHIEPAVANYVLKIENSWSELDSDLVAASRNQVTQNYRAYESSRALAQFRDAGVVEKIIGAGWGSSVYLVADTASSTATFTRREAPILHNGYLYYLTKSGVLGLSLYVLLLVVAAWTAMRCWVRSEPEPVRARASMLLALVIVLTASTITVSGFASKSSFYCLAFLMGLLLVGQRDASARTRGYA
ncbi:hypothetical protein [Pseudonocardia kunmingensis]|uniref:hypothetical protein n=1 Tax=Pseudonocardia kunmingensis TaxID=630975 RepID=UPI00114D71ED|nr:hypothetical protein [Pseudonocardia kunmingensis]